MKEMLFQYNLVPKQMDQSKDDEEKITISVKSSSREAEKDNDETWRPPMLSISSSLDSCISSNSAIKDKPSLHPRRRSAVFENDSEDWTRNLYDFIGNNAAIRYYSCKWRLQDDNFPYVSLIFTKER